MKELRYMARGTTSYYGRRYTIATPMTHLYMLCALYFLLDRGVCGFGRLSRVWRGDGSSFMECPLSGSSGKVVYLFDRFFADGRWCVSGASGKLCVDVDS